MARPLRIECSNGLYHVTARGNARMDIFSDDIDRKAFLDTLEQSCDRYNWLCHAYCLMSNHYHLLIETIDPTLCKGMKHLNGQYAQNFNSKRRRIGHVFQGRYKAIMVEKESYLMELSRYIVLNPVRAGMVHAADDWLWSSYRATLGLDEPHACLFTDWLLSTFGDDRLVACNRYKRFVDEGKGQPAPWRVLKNQIYLGSDQFIEDMQSKLNPNQSLLDIPKRQKQSPPKTIEIFKTNYPDRKEGMARAYLSGHYSLSEIGHVFGVSYVTVSRAVRKFELDVKCKV